MLLSVLIAVTVFVASLAIASRYLDSIANGIAPDLRSGKRPLRPAKFSGWIWNWLLVTLASVLWVRGPLIMRYVLAAVVAVAFAVQFYALRLRPMFVRGASSKQRAILLALAVVGAISLGYLLILSARQGNAG